MSETAAPVEHRLYPHQMRSNELAFTYPITFVAGGVRNGKTRAAVAWCMSRSGWGPFGVLPPPGKPRIGWIVVPTITPMWEHVRPEWESMWGFKESGGLIIDQKLAPQHTYTVECPDGIPMTWYVKSAEFPDRLRAATIWAAWMTEAAMNHEAVYSIVQQRVIASSGTIFMETSPFGLNWFYKRVMERACYIEDWGPTKAGGAPKVIARPERDKRIAGIMGIAIEMNESIDKEAIVGLRADASIEEARREYDGQFFSWSGLVWKSFDPGRHVWGARQGNPHHPTDDELDGAEVISGMDFGWEHPFAHLYIAKLGKKYIVVDEYREAARVLKDHAKMVKGSEYAALNTYRYADPSAAQARAEMLDYGVSSAKAENDVDLGCNAVAQAIESDNFFISPRCEKLINEIGNYHRDEKTGKIVKVGDDLCDALRYAIYSDKMHGGGFTLPHYSPDESGKMKVQSDDPEFSVEMPDDTIPLAGPVDEGYDSDGQKEII